MYPLACAAKHNAIDRMAYVRGHLKRICNTPATTTLGDKYVTVKWPGFTFDDFNRAGKLDFLRLMRKFEELARFTLESTKQTSENTAHDAVPILLAQHVSLLPSLYRRAKIVCPVDGVASAVDVGRTSRVTRLKIVADDGTEFLNVFHKFVFVNKMTRRPVRIPDEGLSAIRQIIVEGVDIPPFLKGPLAVPDENVYNREITVRYDDMDFLLHANAQFFTRAFLDTAAFAARDGFLAFASDFGDICFHSLKEMTGLHTGEAFAGDRLMTNIWIDSDCNSTVFCVIKNCETGNALFHGRYTFHEEPIDVL